MDVFALLFIVSFLALILALVMHIRKCMNNGDVVVVVKEDVKTVVENCYSETVSDVTTKWKESLPKHVTRIKLRNSRKLRNKRKGKK